MTAAGYPYPAQGSSPVDVPDHPSVMSGTERFWPERGLRTGPRPVFLALAVGALAAVVLPDRNLGLGTLLILLVSGALMLTLSVRHRRPWTVAATVLCLGLGSLVVLRDAEWLARLAVLAAGVLVTTSLTDAKRVLPICAGGLAWVLSGIHGLPLLGRTMSAATKSPVAVAGAADHRHLTRGARCLRRAVRFRRRGVRFLGVHCPSRR
ncbi:hypothetical protein [Arthrobacter sp. HLT1-21]